MFYAGSIVRKRKKDNARLRAQPSIASRYGPSGLITGRVHRLPPEKHCEWDEYRLRSKNQQLS
jgi:hypothetical protein